MGRKDLYSKRLLENAKNVADVANFLLFKLGIVVSPEDVQRLDGEQAALGSKMIRRRVRDRLWRVSFTMGGREFAFILGIEVQSEICYDMPVRVMQYDALSYADQIKTCEAQHRQMADLTDAASFLSGSTRDDRFIPVVTVVLYFGKNRWDGALKLSDMLVTAPGMRALIQEQMMHLIDPHRLTEQQLLMFESEFREVFAFIKYADNWQKLTRFLKLHSKDRAIKGDAIDVINVFTKAKIKRVPRQEEVKMCQAIIDIQQIARKEGRKEGIIEGEKRGEKRGVKLGEMKNLLANIRSLNKTLGLSDEEAMKILRVPKAKREAVREQLAKS